MRQLVDLHTHSNCSDGELTPAELVRQAHAKGLVAIALTDHDTVAGLAEAAGTAAGLGIRFVPGVEMSARFAGGTLHILGLGIDATDRQFGQVLENLRAARSVRNPLMIAKLRYMGIPITLDDVVAAAGGGVISRLHVANVLVGKGCVKTVAEAFERYIGEGRPAYVDKERLTPSEAMAAIRAAGGVAVIAHPIHLGCANSAQLHHVVTTLMHDGAEGIEVYHSDHDDLHTRQYLDLARRLGLLVSGGSDYHGAGKPEVRLGRPAVPLAAAQQLLDRLGAG